MITSRTGLNLQGFLAAHAASSPSIYYTREGLGGFDEMPANLVSPKAPGAPLWLQIILGKFPSFSTKEVTDSLNKLMAVQDPDELSSVRSVAKATVTAISAGMRAIRPGVSQRAGRIRGRKRMLGRGRARIELLAVGDVGRERGLPESSGLACFLRSSRSHDAGR